MGHKRPTVSERTGSRGIPAGANRTTSLWAVIESMQRRLEAEGLDREVVDAAVARGLEALLEIEARPPSPKPARRLPDWLRQRALAKA